MPKDYFKNYQDFNKVIVCCGSGGVGKTTVAASIGYMLAKSGNKVCVITIDPAKRLAQALGISSLTSEPTRLELDVSGELYSMMLDTQATFDALIKKYAASNNQAELILQNRIYQSLSRSLGGTQEYMASEKLFELAKDKNFDVVVVDTPPSRNALEFLESPTRLARFLENRIIRLLLMPSRSYLKAVNFAAQSLIKSVSKAVGADLIGDAIDFFRAFEGMEEGFRQRAREMEKLFRSQACQFWLVCAPKRETILEAKYFKSALNKLGIEVSRVIINKALGDFRDIQLDLLKRPETESSDSLDYDQARQIVTELVEKLNGLREREKRNIDKVIAEMPNIPVVVLPLLAEDVHDLKTLGILAVKIEAQIN